MTPTGRRLLTLAVPLLWALVLVSAAGAIHAKHRARELFVQLEKVNAERDRLDIEYGRLQLEQSAWSAHAFVENMASTNLRMSVPPPAQVEVVAP
jgi:cell division protein FtsL